MADEAIGGMTPTGRRLAGPAVDLVELRNAKGLKHLELAYHERYRGHASLAEGLVLGWMERPDVTGLARLTHSQPEQGRFVYATGTCFPLAEVVRVFAEEGKGAGVKAGLELCYLVAEALSDAAESGIPQGVLSHGNLNPWTVVIRPDGQPLVLGYGLPQVEMRVFADDSRAVPREDSWRYAPPERIDGGEEDIASDIFSLALLGLELMMGQPVYDGLLDDVRRQASRGEGTRRLYQWRDQLPSNVRDVLGRALKPDPDTRFGSGLDFVYAVHDLLGSIDVEGPPLVEVMGRVRSSISRATAPTEGGKTGMLTPEQLAELAADLEDFDDKPLPPPRRARPEVVEEAEDEGPAPRFASRRGRERNPSEPEPSTEPADSRGSLRDRLRSRSRPSEAPAEAGSARERLLRRLKDDRGAAGGDTGRRRLRRTVGEEAADAPPRRPRRAGERSSASQSVDIGDPLGFDAQAQAEAAAEAEAAVTPTPAPARPPADDLAPVAVSAPLPEGPDTSDQATTVGPSGLDAAGNAAALLEKLRGSTGGRRERRGRRSRSTDETPSAPPAAPSPEAPAPREAAPPVPEPSGPEVDEDEAPTPRPAPQRAAAPPVEAAAPPPAAMPTPGPRLRAPDGREVVVAGGPSMSVAEAVFLGATRLGLVRADAGGRLVVAWRGDRPGRERAGDGTLTLQPVAAAVARCTVDVAGTVHHLGLPTAVPSAWIAADLVAVLGLDGPHRLGTGERALGPFELLDGLDTDGDGLWLRPG